MAVNIAFRANTSISVPGNWNEVSADPTVTGQAIADLIDDAGDATGVSLWVTTSFNGATSSGTLATAAAHGVPKEVWQHFWQSNGASAVELRGFSPGQTGIIKVAGEGGQAARDTEYSVNGQGSYLYDASGAEPFTAPVEIPFTADGSGTVELAGSVVSVYWYLTFMIVEPQPGPSIEITNDLQPGASFTLNYSHYDAVPVSPATITDSNNNSITVPVTISDSVNGTTGKHEGTATGTMPALPSSGSIAGLKFGTVNVSLSSA